MKTNCKIQIHEGYFGFWIPKKEDDGTTTFEFKRLGRAVFVDNVLSNIEDHSVKLGLRFKYMDEPRYVTISRAITIDYNVAHELSKKGADVSRKTYDAFVDSIRMQEEDLANLNISTEKVYSHLGWINVPVRDEDGNIVDTKLQYRAHKLIPNVGARYDGNYHVTPCGSLKKWVSMITDDVISNIPLEIVVLAGFSSIIVGLISSMTIEENPIFHLYYGSRSGKSTAIKVAASIFGKPFDGVIGGIDKNGEKYEHRSIYGNWSMTENAITAQCSGNKGAVVILNELGKFKGRDLGALIYNLSEGTDKFRSNIKQEVTTIENYATTILSTGEISLLDSCKGKVDGLLNRVIELEERFTTDAEHSKRLIDVCTKNYGSPSVAVSKHIVEAGGADYVLAIYNNCVNDIIDGFPAHHDRASFVAKFPALLLTTAKIVANALKINFSEVQILEFFIKYFERRLEVKENENNSYLDVIETCRTEKNCFITNSDDMPRGKIYGKISSINKHTDDGRIVSEEYMIRPSFLKEALKKKGYDDMNTCIRKWKEMGVMVYDSGHSTVKRKIDKESERVYVLRVFKDGTPVIKSNLLTLLDNKEDD